ncbi:MAG: Hpt domain-containing protein [Rubrivivax sp.]|nr:Hpt domain-containing protein [Rubrivivax sp.]
MNDTPSAPPLDSAALARLHDLDPDGRYAVVARVLAAFDKSLTRMLARLAGEGGGESAAEINKTETIADMAHTLKSSSASVGASALARACAEIEARQRVGDTAALHADTARLVAEAAAAQLAVRAILQP